MKTLLIGFGSIGKRHFEILSKMSKIKSIDIVTKQKIKYENCYGSLNEIDDLNLYDYFVIASETNKHFEQLRFLKQKIKNKLIFCEKPLFETKRNLKITNNKVFVGYVLRFNPILQKLKKILTNEKILFIHAKCGQFLPNWRQERNYKESYSASKEKGGGVLLDLSHEIDYVHWLCGKLKKLYSIQEKVSDLNINSDDFTIIVGKTKKNILVNISIDYLSKKNHRDILIETSNHTYELDLIMNKLKIYNKLGIVKNFSCPNLEKNYIFKKMHSDILGKKTKACTYNEGLEVMDIISIIQEQNNE